MVMHKNDLVALLEKQIVRLKFKKVDGSERTMNCTLKNDVVVPYFSNSSTSKMVNDNVVPVWDVDKNAWRSFRMDSVVEIYK